MNINSLHSSLNYIAYCGNTLTNEQCVILQNSLIILQNENNFANVFLWGRIFGLDNDYFIAFGYEKDALKGRIFYYSTDLTNWGILPVATKRAKRLALLSSTRFQGDAALQLDVNIKYPIEVDYASNEKESSEEPLSEVLKEEDRLAATVALISDESAVVPRGALLKRTDRCVVQNLAFKGLSSAEAQQLNSYQHYRIPQQRWNTNLLVRQDYNFAIDFLDTIDIDISAERCWSLKFQQGGQFSTLQNLYWPGMIFYHSISTSDHGFIYIGNGRKNMDLPFMI
ncbi:radial spoke head protein 9 homolog [Periplaneta americana]|uniref:radial spoke head protein 9 homolog n=1 Tax=Periplaneta americana TaxID=6978 RepID=UPI0037E97D4C